MRNYSLLTADEKRKACQIFCEATRTETYQPLRDILVNTLAGIMRFRPKTVQRLPDEQVGTFLMKHIHRRELSYLVPLIVLEWVRQQRAELLTFFYDGIGVTHSDGSIVDAAEEIEPDTLINALQNVVERYGTRDVLLLVGALQTEFTFPYKPMLAPALEHIQLDATPRESEEEGVVVEEGADAALPENAEGITTLDRVLIMSVVASVFGEEGALSEDEITDLVEEVVDLNASRVRSLFHRGFMQSIGGRELAFDFNAANEHRMIWYLCGVLFGYIRQRKNDKCLEIMRQQRDLVKSMIQNLQLPCATMLLQYIRPMLRDNGQIELLCMWASHRVKYLLPHDRLNYFKAFHQDAATFYDRGMVVEARQLLDVLTILLRDETELSDAALRDLRLRNERKLAQVYQRNRDFNAAREILLRLREEPDFEDKPNVLSDLALISAGFTSLLDILPTQNEDSKARIHDALANGLECLRAAVEQFGEHATNAHLCLGVYYFLHSENGEPVSAITHFNNALIGMAGNRSAYMEGNLVEWTKFCNGIALLETCEPFNYQLALQSLKPAMETNFGLPVWLWMRALKAAELYDNKDLYQSILEYLHAKQGDRIFDHLRRSKIIPPAGPIWEGYVEWLRQAQMTSEDRWEELRCLHEDAVTERDIHKLEVVLDEMETLAVRFADVRTHLLDLLGDAEAYTIAWDDTAADFCRVKLYELEGNYAQCGALIRNRVFHLLAIGDQYSVSQAETLYEYLQEIGAIIDEDAHIDERIRQAKDRHGQAEVLPEHGINEIAWSILYVGGNEIQAQYEERLREELEVTYPNATFEFVFPGWDSNWNEWYWLVEPILNRSQVIVINNLIRTNFGRKIRAACDAEHRWYSCNGRGMASIRRSIEDAISNRIAQNQH